MQHIRTVIKYTEREASQAITQRENAKCENIIYYIYYETLV